MVNTQLTTYEKKVLSETDGDYTTYWMLELCGKCEFCGHHSKMGYRVTNKQSGKKMLVGTDCVFTLTNLDRTQQRIAKKVIERQKHFRKYEPVRKYLLEQHGNELITKNDYWLKYTQKNSRQEVTKEEGDYVFYNWVDEDGSILLRNKMTKEEWESQKRVFHVNEAYNAPKTPINIAGIILNKIETTKSNINKYWFDTYKELTGVDIRKIK